MGLYIKEGILINIREDLFLITKEFELLLIELIATFVKIWNVVSYVGTQVENLRCLPSTFIQ